jgi:hypothetical protein
MFSRQALTGSGSSLVAGSFLRDNDPSGFVKGREFLQELSDCQLSKNASAAWSE